jgi:hypothetical protein
MKDDHDLNPITKSTCTTGIVSTGTIATTGTAYGTYRIASIRMQC